MVVCAGDPNCLLTKSLKHRENLRNNKVDFNNENAKDMIKRKGLVEHPNSNKDAFIKLKSLINKTIQKNRFLGIINDDIDQSQENIFKGYAISMFDKNYITKLGKKKSLGGNEIEHLVRDRKQAYTLGNYTLLKILDMFYMMWLIADIYHAVYFTIMPRDLFEIGNYELIINLVFVPDMILMFFRMPRDKKGYMTLKDTAHRYLTSTFIFDLIANLSLNWWVQKNIAFLQFLRVVN